METQVIVAIIAAIATVTAALIGFLPHLRELARSTQQASNSATTQPAPYNSTAGDSTRRLRQILLNKVRNYWVNGVLETSLQGKATLELGLEERLDAISQLWGNVWETPEPARLLPPEMTVIDRFDQLGEGRSLLILGQPGSGKTITLLRLADALIEQAERDVHRPIPVVFNLSSWTREPRSLANWLIQELNTKYQVSKPLGSAWVQAQQILPLLDGLDEVRIDRREACVHAINQFMLEYGQTELVLCSRIRDYEALSTRLNVQSALCIQPLTLPQIRRYLIEIGLDKTDCTLLQSDPALQELAKSPLILSIATVAYQGATVGSLSQLSPEEQRRHLFDAYLERMLTRRAGVAKLFSCSGSNRTYNREQAKRWLIWLAQRMSEQSQTIFLIERLYVNWLHSALQKWTYAVISCLVMGSVFAVIFWLSGTLTWGLQRGLAVGLLAGIVFSLLNFALLGILFILNQLPLGQPPARSFQAWLFSANVGLNSGCLMGFIAVIHHSLAMGFMIGGVTTLIAWSMDWLTGGTILLGFLSPVESLRWSWSHLKHKLFFWLPTGVVGCFSLGLAGVLSRNLGINLLSGLIIGLTFGVLSGLSSDSGIEVRIIPNQGIWRSIKTAIITTLVGLLGFIWVAHLLGVSPFFGAFSGLWIGWMLGGGACVVHISLRVTLYLTRCSPWNYARFLDWACDRLLLQKVGGGHMFAHRLLLEHLASLKLNEP